MLLCKFCSKECKNNNSLINHERLCKNNPKRQQSHFSSKKWAETRCPCNQFTKNKSWKFSDETIKKMKESASGKKHSEKTKSLLSEYAFHRGLGGHTSKKKLHFLKKDGTTVYLQSSYEIDFANLLENMNLSWTRPEPLLWKDKSGKLHRYYPDFMVGNIYIDTKNDYLAVKDLPKIEAVRSQNKVDIRIVTKDLINKEYIAGLAELAEGTGFVIQRR